MHHERNAPVDGKVAPENVMETVCIPAQTLGQTAFVSLLGNQRIACRIIHRTRKMAQDESNR